MSGTFRCCVTPSMFQPNPPSTRCPRIHSNVTHPAAPASAAHRLRHTESNDEFNQENHAAAAPKYNARNATSATVPDSDAANGAPATVVQTIHHVVIPKNT